MAAPTKPGEAVAVDNLDILAITLSRTLGKSVAHWRNVITDALATHGVSLNETKLLEPLLPGEADVLLNKLRKEEQGILRWVAEGMAMAQQAKPNGSQRLANYLYSRRN